MERLHEEEKQESLFDDPQEEMEVKDDQSSCKRSKMKIRSKDSDIEQLSKLMSENQEDQEINTDQMQKI